MEELRYCKKCDNHKPLTEEYWHHRKSRKDGWEFYCKECVKSTTKKNYNKNKDKWREYQNDFKKKFKDSIQKYKETLTCSKCDENRWYLLDFHHLDPLTKQFGIGDGSSYTSLENTFNEIKKCIPLCSNCHREFHYYERTKNINMQEYLNNNYDY